MDLAEIRKKARLQNSSQGVDPRNESLPQPANVEVGETVQNPSPENFWASELGLSVATEEEYALGQLSHELKGEEDTVQWVTFNLGDEEYALELSSVLELIKPRHLTELPQVPDYLLGIVSLRGIIVPVIDLSRRVLLKECQEDSQQRVIVCSFDGQHVGLLVDRVTQVVRVDRNKVEAPPLVLDEPGKDFVAGVGRVQGRMFILLDPAKVMDIEPLESLQS